MILGFTGTRRGVTGPQYTTLTSLIRSLAVSDGPIEAHHGDCTGADAEFHAAVRRILPYAKIVVHPPDDSSFRANCKGDVILPTRPYLVRNQDIVNASDRIIATPKEDTDQQRGGTWSTIRKAVRAGKPVTIVWPDGRTEER